jgi:hypothetical protein
MSCTICGRFVPYDSDSATDFGDSSDYEPPDPRFYYATCAEAEERRAIETGRCCRITGYRLPGSDERRRRWAMCERDRSRQPGGTGTRRTSCRRAMLSTKHNGPATAGLTGRRRNSKMSLRCVTQIIAHWPFWRTPLREDKATSIKTDPYPEGRPGSAGDVTPGTGSRKAMRRPPASLGRCEQSAVREGLGHGPHPPTEGSSRFHSPDCYPGVGLIGVMPGSKMGQGNLPMAPRALKGDDDG